MAHIEGSDILHQDAVVLDREDARLIYPVLADYELTMGRGAPVVSQEQIRLRMLLSTLTVYLNNYYGKGF
jgi:hypothetical protein